MAKVGYDFRIRYLYRRVGWIPSSDIEAGLGVTQTQILDLVIDSTASGKSIPKSIL